MMKHILTTSVLTFVACFTVHAESAQDMIPGRSDLKSVYEISDIGAQRTLLTRENKFPGIYGFELGGYYNHTELDLLERDTLGVEGRIRLGKPYTLGAKVPVVLDSEFMGSSERGLGDVVLNLDLLAFQDIFRYPFVIPHVDVTLPTGDEDKGLGSGETIVNLGISVGTKVYDQLTYIVDFSYGFNGASYFMAGDENMYMISGSIVWDISERFAVLAEGRVYEDIDDVGDTPYEVQGGLIYMGSRNVQFGAYGGVLDLGDDDDYNLASVRLTVQF